MVCVYVDKKEQMAKRTLYALLLTVHQITTDILEFFLYFMTLIALTLMTNHDSDDDSDSDN